MDMEEEKSLTKARAPEFLLNKSKVFTVDKFSGKQ